jgi:pyruvate/2-oxoglutarate dehydrogenase complex dihydrolipoamide acyltransferase (E2) component
MVLVEIKAPVIPDEALPVILQSWSKKIGEQVAIKEAIADLETSKVILEVEATASGVLAEILISVGETVNSGQTIAIINTDGYDQSLAPQTLLQLRMAKYCCGMMFHAVTDNDAKTKFTSHVFRGELCWSIGEDLCCPSFCPWCGSDLPNSPFEP